MYTQIVWSPQWIPAFAGMTMKLADAASASRRVFACCQNVYANCLVTTMDSRFRGNDDEVGRRSLRESPRLRLFAVVGHRESSRLRLLSACIHIIFWSLHWIPA